MKNHIKFVIPILAVFAISSFQIADPATSYNHSEIASSDSTVFDADLAQKLGADEYGMRSYVMAFLKIGPNRDFDADTAREIQAGHMAHIHKMSDDGKLILAGPFLDRGEIRGIFLFNVATVEEARELTAQDPAIQAGSLVMELHPWYGSAALLTIPEVHNSITKIRP